MQWLEQHLPGRPGVLDIGSSWASSNRNVSSLISSGRKTLGCVKCAHSSTSRLSCSVKHALLFVLPQPRTLPEKGISRLHVRVRCVCFIWHFIEQHTGAIFIRGLPSGPYHFFGSRQAELQHSDQKTTSQKPKMDQTTHWRAAALFAVLLVVCCTGSAADTYVPLMRVISPSTATEQAKDITRPVAHSAVTRKAMLSRWMLLNTQFSHHGLKQQRIQVSCLMPATLLPCWWHFW